MDTPLIYRVEVEYEGRIRVSAPVSLANAVVLSAAARKQGLDEVRIVPVD